MTENRSAASLFEAGRPDAFSIRELYDSVEEALARAFPRGGQLWVRGEIHSITDRTGHCYIDLADPDGSRSREEPVLKVKCWRSTWEPVKRLLRKQGIHLEPGMVVTLRGRVDFYRARAEIGFVVSEVDVSALLGRLAAQRAALLESLSKEGLLERNRRLAVSNVPLRIALVASPGTEGFRDFMGRLENSLYAFDVTNFAVPVQGAGAPPAVARAVLGATSLAPDLLVLVRGGGSKADLSAFDTEIVARAVANSPVPVWTGIGHTGDQSVTDVVANRSFVTPTECGQEIVRSVESWWTGILSLVQQITRASTRVMDAASSRDDHARARLVSCTRSHVHLHGERLGQRATRLALMAPRCAEGERMALLQKSMRLASHSSATLDRQYDRVEAWRRLMSAYDVERQLERGYTLTFDSAGTLVRSISDLSAGSGMLTRFAKGTVRSTVDHVEE